MKLSYQQIFGMLPEVQQRKIISAVHERSKALLISYYSDTTTQKFAGFRNAVMVPAGMLITQAVRDALRDNRFAGRILAEWFNYQNDLVELISKCLYEIDCIPQEPDFKSGELAIRTLPAGHCCKRDEAYYFCPNGSSINGAGEVEATLMALLLGWFQEDAAEAPQKIIAAPPVENPVEPPGEVLKDTTAQMENPANPNARDNSGTQQALPVAPLSTDIPGTALEESLPELEQNLQHHEVAKQHLVEQLHKLADACNKETFDDTAHDIPDLYAALRERHRTLSEEMVRLRQAMASRETLLQEQFGIDPSGAPLAVDSKLMQQLTGIKKHTLQLMNKIKKYLLNLTGEIEAQIANDPARAELVPQIEALAHRIGDMHWEDLPEMEAKIKQLQADLAQELPQSSFPQLIAQFAETQDPALWAELLEAVRRQGAEGDLLFLLLLGASQGMPLPERFTELAIEIVSRRIATHGAPFLAGLCGYSPFRNQLVATEDGKTFFALLSLAAHIFGTQHQVVANLFYENTLERLAPWEQLNRLAECICYETPFALDGSAEPRLNGLKVLLTERFKTTDNRYVNLTNGIDPKFQTMEAKYIYPSLETVFRQISSMKQDRIQRILTEIHAGDYVDTLYDNALKRSGNPANRTTRKRIEKTLQSILEELDEYARLMLDSLENSAVTVISTASIIQESEEMCQKIPALLPVAQLIRRALENTAETPSGLGVPLEHFIIEIILDSLFLAANTPGLVAMVDGQDAGFREMFNALLLTAENELTPAEAAARLIDSAALQPARLLIRHYRLPEAALNNAQKSLQETLEKHESYARQHKLTLSEQYAIAKENQRWSFALNYIKNLVNIHKEQQKQIALEKEIHWKQLKKAVLSHKAELIDEEAQYRSETYAILQETLDFLEKISLESYKNAEVIVTQMIDEIKHIRQFKESAVDVIRKLKEDFEFAQSDELSVETEMPDLQLKQVYEFIETDNYEALNLTPEAWDEISDNRRENILELIESWIYLHNRPVVRDEVREHPEQKKIELHLQRLCKNLARICSLYSTGETEHNSDDMFDEWRRHSEPLPFIFKTEIKQPRCQALKRDIRLYVITNYHLKNRRTIKKISDYIEERGYNKNSYTMIMLIGDRDKFDHLNNNQNTKDLPVIDEKELEKIILSVKSRRLPKWQFTSLLTLTRKISTLQPFHAQGSITSDQDIFVGREDIIRSFVTSPRDFAIYGGRRIGKSSLMVEMRNQLEAQNFIAVYTSFQGNQNSLFTARGIYTDLCHQFRHQPENEINSFDEFKLYLKSLYDLNPDQDVAIFLDEVDEYIIREKDKSEHRIIEIFRALSQETNHKWRFIFAGFKEMYLEINGKGKYTNTRSPWRNFFDASDNRQRLSELKAPRELINEGLRNILGLDYGLDVANRIVDYSTGHPAMLQMFCQCLVNSIDNRVSLTNRTIHLEDVDRIFEENDDFIKFVYSTFRENLSDLQRVIVFFAAFEDWQEFTFSKILHRLKAEIESYKRKLLYSDENILLEFDLLAITGVIKPKEKSGDHYQFSHPYYIRIIKRFDRLDNNEIFELLTSISSD